MGLDLLDLNFRLEKQFRIRVEAGDWESLGRGRIPLDFTVKELALFVAERLDRARRSRLPDRTFCDTCRHPVGGLFGGETCPGCGTPIVYDGPIWEPLRQTICDVVGADPDEVHQDALLAKDLGASW